MVRKSGGKHVEKEIKAEIETKMRETEMQRSMATDRGRGQRQVFHVAHIIIIPYDISTGGQRRSIRLYTYTKYIHSTGEMKTHLTFSELRQHPPRGGGGGGHCSAPAASKA